MHLVDASKAFMQSLHHGIVNEQLESITIEEAFVSEVSATGEGCHLLPFAILVC